MSYIINPSERPYYLQCTKEHVVPLFVRPTFLDYVTFTLATRFGRLAADPALGSYTDLEGGLYYNTVAKQFKYRDDVSWKFFVTVDGSGPNPVADNGIARFSGTGGQIQGSLAELDDNGKITCVGVVTTAPVTLIGNTGANLLRLKGPSEAEDFIGVQEIGQTEEHYKVDSLGTTQWSTGTGTNRFVMTKTSNPNEMRIDDGSTGGARIVMPNDSRLAARRVYSALGNSVDASYRVCPVWYCLPTSVGTSSASLPSAGSVSDGILSTSLPSNSLNANGDTLEIDIYSQTNNDINTKGIRITFGSRVATAVFSGLVASPFWVRAVIRRRTATTVDLFIFVVRQNDLGGSFLVITYTGSNVINFASSNTLVMTMEQSHIAASTYLENSITVDCLTIKGLNYFL